ncbi:MAG: hypothetical protein ACI8VR_003033, partial [Candidatus Azotimanducaceae bacterium]
MSAIDSLKTKISDDLETQSLSGKLGKGLGIILIALLTFIGILGFLWDSEPEQFDVNQLASTLTSQLGVPVVSGSTTV